MLKYAQESADFCHFVRSAQVDQQHLIGSRKQVLKFSAREFFRLRWCAFLIVRILLVERDGGNKPITVLYSS
jgi:hypothetical protein